jgi:hypothetical protein
MQKFNKWIDSKVSSSPIPGMLVYPEGGYGCNVKIRLSGNLLLEKTTYLLQEAKGFPCVTT